MFFVVASNMVQHYYHFWLPEFEEDWEAWFEYLDYVYQFTLLIEPFLYGALGSSIYLLRKSEQFLKTREFDPGRIPEHWNRLILGTLCGGSIILFITGVESDDGNLLQISAAALGFLAGYSVDFLFKTADRIIEAILPKVGLTTAQLKRRTHETNEIIAHYEDLLNSTKDEKQQKFIKEIINDLKRL